VIRASIVVPTYTRAGLLPKLLESLVNQDYEGEYEVLIVDDGSGDGTPEVLGEWSRRFPERIRVFFQRNSGPAAARNRGAQEAKGRFVAFIDDDCSAEAGWLRSLEETLEGTGAAAAAGTVVNLERTWVGRYTNRESVIDHVVSTDGSVAEFITANACVRIEIFKEIGGFDEAIRVAGGEDTDFSLRLRSAGYRIARAQRACVNHSSYQTCVEYLRMIYRHGRGRRRLGERFPGYRIRLPLLRLLWLAWPLRGWPIRDYGRYRAGDVPRRECLQYLWLRYLENIVRITGYMRGL